MDVGVKHHRHSVKRWNDCCFIRALQTHEMGKDFLHLARLDSNRILHPHFDWLILHGTIIPRQYWNGSDGWRFRHTDVRRICSHSWRPVRGCYCRVHCAKIVVGRRASRIQRSIIISPSKNLYMVILRPRISLPHNTIVLLPDSQIDRF